MLFHSFLWDKVIASTVSRKTREAVTSILCKKSVISLVLVGPNSSPRKCRPDQTPSQNRETRAAETCSCPHQASVFLATVHQSRAAMEIPPAWVLTKCHTTRQHSSKKTCPHSDVFSKVRKAGTIIGMGAVPGYDVLSNPSKDRTEGLGQQEAIGQASSPHIRRHCEVTSHLTSMLNISDARFVNYLGYALYGRPSVPAADSLRQIRLVSDPSKVVRNTSDMLKEVSR